ncbi:MAG: hypothetical protein LBS23_00155 [Holosporaceae bacterium]|jgi:uncharacterized Fe-S cluster-containing radical SAM superfamily protein|nr:hypothetical protein [Holosporaceae bacterium]
MRYESLQGLSEEGFRRLTGVKPSTFKHMVEILDTSYKSKRWHGGRSSKLCVEDQLLINSACRETYNALCFKWIC